MEELLRCDPRAFGVPTVVQAIEAQRVTGRLVLARGDDEVGTAEFRSGRLVRATCGAIDGRAAFFDLFTAPATTLRVLPADVADGPPLGDGFGLLIEACRLADDWARVGPCRPVEPGVDLPGLGPLQAGETVREAASRLGVSRSGLVDALRPLFDDGRLIATSEPETGFHAALEQGLRHHRRGDGARALEAFDAALALRPDDYVARQNRARLLELRPDLQIPGSAP